MGHQTGTVVRTEDSEARGPERQTPEELTGAVQRNIQALVALRREFEARKTGQHRVADAITRFAGSMGFVGGHALLVIAWLIINTGHVPSVRPFDPYPFVMLAMIASVEAIFLTAFVLISQNRMSELADQRADLDLQIGLLAEQEITHVIGLLDAMSKQLGLQASEEAKSEELKKTIDPGALVRELEKVAKQR